MKVKFRDWDCIVKKSKYVNNDNLALMLFDEETGDPVATATVNTGDKLSENVAYVKSYSENVGMLEALKNAGLVEEILRTKSLGHAQVELVKFNLEKVDEM